MQACTLWKWSLTSTSHLHSCVVLFLCWLPTNLLYAVVSLHAQFRNVINNSFRSIMYGSNFTYVVPAEVPVPVQQVLSNSRNQPQPESKAPEPLMIACMALLLCNNAVCDRDMFAAIVDSGLVFDGGLVVDTVCKHL
jgi:hypothetical protein